MEGGVRVSGHGRDKTESHTQHPCAVRLLSSNVTSTVTQQTHLEI